MQRLLWQELNPQAQNAALERPAITASARVGEIVSGIINQVRDQGDSALKALSERFDREVPAQLKLDNARIAQAEQALSGDLKKALQHAYQNIRTFHSAQVTSTLRVDTQPGIRCELHSRPIDAVGLYIPGGSAPLPSTVLMLGVPAELAGCPRRVLVSPPPIADEIIYAASLCGIDEIYQVGGAQAIAALAYGTETIAPVDKIFGPGNSYVTEAKRQVSQALDGAAIDMPAGPSEVLVIADERANPQFVAADLLSQAEHGADSQVILVTPSPQLADQVEQAVAEQVARLSRQNIAQEALTHSRIIICEDRDEAVKISNAYGPEHLILQTGEPRKLLPAIRHAGSVFIGDLTPESVGDYASGTNHVLPTYGFVRTYSSLSLADFSKRFTVQELSAEGLNALADTVTAIADAEGLDAHANAVRIRVNNTESN